MLDGGGERSKHVVRDAVEARGCVAASMLNGGSELGICGWSRKYPVKFESKCVGFWVDDSVPEEVEVYGRDLGGGVGLDERLFALTYSRVAHGAVDRHVCRLWRQ